MSSIHLDSIEHEREGPGSKAHPYKEFDSRFGSFGCSNKQHLGMPERDMLKPQDGRQSPSYEQVLPAQRSSSPAALSPAPTSHKDQRPSKQKRLHFKQAAEQMIKEIKKDPLSFNMEDVEGKLPMGVANNSKAKEKFLGRIQIAHAKAIAAQQRKACARHEGVFGRVISL